MYLLFFILILMFAFHPFNFLLAFSAIGRTSARSSSLKMSIFQPNPTGLVGDIAPTGFFDPLGLATGKDAATLKQYREP